MTNKIEISRELLTILADLNCPYDQLIAAKQRAAEILAAPAVGRQEPVAQRMDFADGNENYGFTESKAHAEKVTADPYYKVIPLYTSPPAPVAVVLPSKQEISSLVWNEVLKAEAIPGVSCFNAAEFAVEAVISLIKELNP